MACLRIVPAMGAAALLVACDLESPGLVRHKDAGPDASGDDSPMGGNAGAGGRGPASTGGVSGSGGTVAAGAAGGSSAGAGGSSAGNGGSAAPSPDGGDGGPGGATDGGDAAPPCTPGLSCTDLGECVHGLTACKNGVSSCVKSENAEDGSTCTAGVCSGGACVACDAGKDCSDPASCQKKKIVCTSGKPVCTASGNKVDGDTCGTNLYCNQGACKPCMPGSSCTPTNPCHKGTATCTGGAIVCNDTGTVVNPGTPCGTNQVCNGASCSPCTADVPCPPSNPCHKGITSCSTGSSACLDQGPRTDSPSCDDGNACTQTDLCQSGTCTGSNPVVCTASDICHAAGICNQSTGVCSNPNAANGKACNDGNACTKTDTCQSGTCTGSNPVVCTASDACHVAGMCDQASGTCSNPVSGPVSCGTNKVCQSGSCVCSGSTTACGNACLDTTSDKSNCGACGKSCGPGSCSGSKCQPFVVTTLGGGSDCYGLATDGPHVVWLNYDSTQPTVLELPAAGGTPTELAQTALPGTTGAQIAMANGTVAWPRPDITKSPSPIYLSTAVEGAANSSASGPLLSVTGTTSGMGISPSGGVAYVTVFDAITPGNIALWSCPLSLPTCTKRRAIGGISTGVAVSGSYVFWTETAAGNVQRYTISDTSVFTVANGQGSPAGIALDSTYAYWVNRISASSFSVARVLQSTSNPSSNPVLPTTAGAANAIATDGTFVYYAGLSGTTNVGYVPVAGGSAKPLSSGGTVNRGNMASAGGYIYWYDSSDKKIRGVATPLN
jgi:hypothetical protein